MYFKRILVVEDDSGIRDTLKDILETEGYSVGTAANGQEALEALKSSDHPCLILLDLMMPVMNGTDFLEYQQANDAISPIPVVVITAAGENRVHSVREKFPVLKKPLDLEHLLVWLKKYCGEPDKKCA